MLHKESSSHKSGVSPNPNQSNIQQKLNTWGMFLSLLCAIHCAATPILLALVSLMGLSFLMDPIWEFLLMGLSGVLALISLSTAYTKHRNFWPFVCFACGVLFITPGLIYHSHVLIGIGSTTVAVALLLNWNFNRQISCC